ncbi:MAG: dihydrodipicolinate synthase family protein [Synergistaceae bacterium]|jgi:4-hydroxy-2-oxoglutarate aldolase|nr:dihydrodipicolinate synthase family protein [Synergistaceae bacterium]
MILAGIYAPVPTPFDEISGGARPDMMAENISKWAGTSLDGFVICGSNGELPFTTIRERADLTRAAREALEKSRVPKYIIAGTFMHSTRETTECCAACADAGADAVLMLPPHYFKADAMKTAVKFFEDVAGASPIPVVLYNMPANTGVSLDATTVKKLSPHPNIIGIKDTSGDMTQMCYLVNECAPGFSVFCGSGNYFLPALSLGASGGTLAVSNLYPESARKLLDAYKNRETEAAKNLHYRLMRASDLLTRQFGVPGLKAAMDRAGLYGGPCRPPLMNLGDENREKLFSALDAAGLDGFENWRR